MNEREGCRIGLGVALALATMIAGVAADRTVEVPKTWDDEAIASLEVPLSEPAGSPKHVTAEYYYRIPVAPIYRTYPVYAPGREPSGYQEWLRQQAPLTVWDGQRRPPLVSQSDWINAGEIVFDAPVRPAFFSVDDVRNPDWYKQTRWPIARDGTVPIVRYVVRQKGVVTAEMFGCATCHTRVLADGTIVKGAQGNFHLGRPNAIRLRAPASQSAAAWNQLRLTARATTAVPWLTPDPEERIDQMSPLEYADVLEAIPPGVNPRHRASPLYPVQIPDLIGVRDRRYLDRTGLQQHRDVADLMRYAAMNRGILDGGDGIANHAGFIPADAPRFRQLPDPATRARYSDEQLFALAQYLYALQPPANPNPVDATAERGRAVFERERCGACHTPPFYTNNKLTPADGFVVPADHLTKFDVLPRWVGTDPGLTMKTRRGTGYYKVPSLKGVWYRQMFGHSGWCATLEDWFDPRRVREDYVPTGFKPHDQQTYAVRGHSFGLALSDADRQALIAFLKTL